MVEFAAVTEVGFVVELVVEFAVVIEAGFVVELVHIFVSEAALRALAGVELFVLRWVLSHLYSLSVRSFYIEDLFCIFAWQSEHNLIVLDCVLNSCIAILSATARNDEVVRGGN